MTLFLTPGVSDGPLSTILTGDAPTFALLHRPHPPGAHRRRANDRVEVLVGDARVVDRLADLTLPPLVPNADRHDVLALLPYRQLTERGFDCHDDATPLVAIDIRARADLSVADAIALLPDDEVVLTQADVDVSDHDYGELVRTVLANEIGRGEGSNFVIRRCFVALVENHSLSTALALFRRLLATESGTYWTFLVRYDGRTLVGATPERHISLLDGIAVMNPISGTYRYPSAGPTVADLVRFLDDRKETEELFMVVDEELKMMGQMCHQGPRLVGPRLKEMARLAHTEYLVQGRTDLDVREVLRATMFAPAVTGSPLSSACRVIAKYEPRGRGYYGGVLALIGQHRGHRTLDASILIRTADISADGRLEIGVGATLVRHSNPDAEVAETRAKAAAILGRTPTPRRGPRRLGADPRVHRALAARNDGLARFWLDPAWQRRVRVSGLAGLRVLLVDAEDDFTAMLGHQVRALGAIPTIRRYDETLRVADHDVVVVGPGPGDPRDIDHPKISALRTLTARLIMEATPFLSVCLGHQVVAGVLGLPVRRKEVPAQGLQREIDLFGRLERVAFYNTYAAYSDAEHVGCELTGAVADVCRDPRSGEVFGLRMPRMRSVQFHVESVLTEHGPAILGDLLVSTVDDHPT